MMNTVKNMKLLGLGLLSSAVLVASCEKKKKETPAPPVVGKFAITDVQVMGRNLPASSLDLQDFVNGVDGMSDNKKISTSSLISPVIFPLLPFFTVESVSFPEGYETAQKKADVYALAILVNDLLSCYNKQDMFMVLNEDAFNNLGSPEWIKGGKMYTIEGDKVRRTISLDKDFNPTIASLYPLFVLLKSIIMPIDQTNLTTVKSFRKQPSVKTYEWEDEFIKQELVGLFNATLFGLIGQAVGVVPEEILPFIQNILAALQLEFNKNSEIVILNAESGKPQLDAQIKTEWVSSTEELKKFKIVYQFDTKNPNALIKVAVSLASMGSGEHQLTINDVEWDWNTVLEVLNTSIDNNTALDNPSFGTLNMRAYLKDMLLQIKQEDAQFKLLIANVLQLLNLGITLQEVKN